MLTRSPTCGLLFDAKKPQKGSFHLLGGQGFMKRCMLDPSGTYPEYLETHPDAYPDIRPFREEFSTMKHTPKHAPETYPNPNMLTCFFDHGIAGNAQIGILIIV